MRSLSPTTHPRTKKQVPVRSYRSENGPVVFLAEENRCLDLLLVPRWTSR